MAKSFKAKLDEIDGKIIALMNEQAIPGMVVGVVKEGKLAHSKGYGLADVAHQTPMSSETVFRIASISKTFTAVGLMQLWEQGRFDLDDPVNDHLKSLKIKHPDPLAPPVTIRHLLTHRAGIGEGRNIKDLVSMAAGKFPEVENEADVPSMGEFVDGLLLTDAYPEQKWAYANNAFGILGVLVEELSGTPFFEYMRANVFERLGMAQTRYTLSEALRAKLATGYRLKNGKLEPTSVKFFPDAGAGSVNSSVEEMALYMAALMNDGENQHGRVLKPETLALMMTPHYREHPRLGAMGLSFFLNDEDGHRVAGHGGTLDGYESEMLVAPDDKLGVIVWANKNTLGLASLAEGILRDLLDLPPYSEKIPAKGVPMPTHLWNELVGSYGPPKGFNSNARIWMMLGGEAEVVVKDGQLRLRGLVGMLKDGFVLTPVDPAEPLLFEGMLFNIPARVIFQRNAEGYVDRFSMTALMFFTFYKRPKTQSVRFRFNLAAGSLVGLLLGGLALLWRRKKKG